MRKATALVFLGLLTAPANAQVVTYTSRAFPLRKVLQDLSAQSGRNLSAADKMASEPLILRVDNTSIDETMKKIADVFSADWIKTPNGYQLARSKERLAALLQKIENDRLEYFRGLIKKLQNDESNFRDLDRIGAEEVVASYRTDVRDNTTGMLRTPWKTQYERSLRLPLMRLAVNIIGAMDPREIADIRNGQRVAWSDQPTAMELPLPKIDPKWMQTFRASRAALADVRKDTTVLSNNELDADSAAVPDVPLRLLMTCSAETSYWREISLTAMDGNSTQQGYVTFDLSPGRLVDNADPAFAYDVPLSAATMELVPHLNVRTDNVRAISDSVLDQLRTPIQFDPLSFATCDTLLGTAEHAHSNLIAVVSDGAELAAQSIARLGKISLEKFNRQFLRTEDTCDHSHGWITITPRDPLAIAANRIPRKLLEDFVAKVKGDRQLTLETAGEFRAALPRNADTLMTSEYLMWLGLITQEGPFLQQKITRLYGLLLADHGSLDNGFEASLASLSPAEQAEIQSMIFDDPRIFGDDEHPFDVPAGQMFFMTDQLPDGAPPLSLVRVNVDTQPVPILSFRDSSGRDYSEESSMDQLPMFLVRALHPKEAPLLPQGYEPPPLLGLQLASHRTLKFRIDLGNGRVIADSIAQRALATGRVLSPTEFLLSLPVEQRTKLETAIQDLIR